MASWGDTESTAADPGCSWSEELPSSRESLLPNPAARPSLSWAYFFSSTWLIANMTTKSTISSVTMSA